MPVTNKVERMTAGNATINGGSISSVGTQLVFDLERSARSAMAARAYY